MTSNLKAISGIVVVGAIVLLTLGNLSVAHSGADGILQKAAAMMVAAVVLYIATR